MLNVETMQERVVSEPREQCSHVRWVGARGDLCYARQNGGSASVVLVQQGQARKRKLVEVPAGVWDVAPSPGGDAVAVSTHSRTTADPVILLARLDGSQGSEARAPGRTRLCPLRLEWSSDGRWLAFDAEVDGQRDVFIMDVARRLARAVAAGPDDEVYPAFRPTDSPRSNEAG